MSKACPLLLQNGQGQRTADSDMLLAENVGAGPNLHSLPSRVGVRLELLRLSVGTPLIGAAHSTQHIHASKPKAEECYISVAWVVTSVTKAVADAV